MKLFNNIYKNATEAFEETYKDIIEYWVERKGTKTLFNLWFYISNSLERVINTPRRGFSVKYALREREWYLSWDPSGKEISKYAPIWKWYMDENWNVNSNYGYQWKRNNQIGYIIDELKKDNYSRRAVISIYDGKEHDKYKLDTPCTCYIQFQIINNELCMSVYMRSNDLVFWFCNDQYQFSMLQEKIAIELWIPVGWYYHHATNFHIYEKHYKMNDNQ